MKKKRNRTAPFKWRPFSRKQKKVLTWWTKKSPYRDYDMIIADGSIRSGKTVSQIDSFLTWSLSQFENEIFIIAGKSMGALKRNVLNPLFQILTAKGIDYKYNRSENFIEIGTNTYYCFGANHEASQDVLQGLTAAGAYADEIALFPKSFVEQMIGRCSVEGSKIFANCNPRGPYHWFKLDYIDKAKEKMILYIHFTMDDNLTLAEKVKERFKRMFSGVFYDRYIRGLWVMAEGIIYDMFKEKEHVISDKEKQKEIIRNADEFFVSNDYGTGTVFVLGLFCVSGGKRYLIKSYYWDAKEEGYQKSDRQYVQDTKDFVEGYSINAFIIPNDALSFIAELYNEGVGPLFIYERTPGSVMDGIRTQANYLKHGEYKIFDNESNQPIIKEYASYVWDEKAQARGEDKPLKENDHGKDMERYFHDGYNRLQQHRVDTQDEEFEDMETISPY